MACLDEWAMSSTYNDVITTSHIWYTTYSPEFFAAGDNGLEHDPVQGGVDRDGIPGQIHVQGLLDQGPILGAAQITELVLRDPQGGVLRQQ